MPSRWIIPQTALVMNPAAQRIAAMRRSTGVVGIGKEVAIVWGANSMSGIIAARCGVASLTRMFADDAPLLHRHR